LPTRRLFAYEAQEGKAGLLTMDIDNTSLEHFAVCARSAQYRLVESREGTANMAAKIYGSAKHIYLEHRLRGGTIPEAEQLMVNFMAENAIDDPQNWRTATHEQIPTSLLGLRRQPIEMLLRGFPFDHGSRSGVQ
jgi:hypothetical protein